LYRIRSNIYCRIDGDVLCRMGISWEYASMMTDKQHNAQLEEADALEIRIEELAEQIFSRLKSQHYVKNAQGHLVHIDDFIADVEIEAYDMSRLICGDAASLQESMQEKLYSFSEKLATEKIEADKS